MSGHAIVPTLLLAALVLAGCETPEQQAAREAAQRAADQNRCAGFGFVMGTDQFAHCMMGLSTQRDAEAAADRRAADARDAADRRAKAAAQAAKDKADQDAWDRRTGQGKYANGSSSSSASSSSSSPFGQNPVDKIQQQIEQQMHKAEGAE